jgi:hypothetical protein
MEHPLKAEILIIRAAPQGLILPRTWPFVKFTASLLEKGDIKKTMAPKGLP